MRRHVLACIALLFACDEGVPLIQGVDEPIRVHGAQFIPGPLPVGTATKPTVTSVLLTNNEVGYGEANKAFSGRATDDGTAVALRLADLGSGYWLLPLGPADVQFPNELTWQVSADFAAQAGAQSPGHHALRYVAVDGAGTAGPPYDVDVCFDPQIPDNGALCNPSRTAPYAVLTLTWDVDADVDLVVVGPSRTTDPKHPTTIPPDAGVLDPTSGKLDRDSLNGCVKDGLRQEDLIWQSPPTGITFDVYANLFSACGQRGVSYEVTLYVFTGTTPVAQKTAKGIFTSYDANGGATPPPGTYLFSYTF
ncbi:MAG TPA: hypothetical protein VGH87_19160 [Polyangiaceae bacterium]